MELAMSGRPYEDVAQKFFEHFIYIANAINGPRGPKAYRFVEKLEHCLGSWFGLPVVSNLSYQRVQTGVSSPGTV